MVRRLNVSTVSDVTISGSVSEAMAIRSCGVTEASWLIMTVTTIG